MYSFRTIRSAILEAGPHRSLLPYGFTITPEWIQERLKEPCLEGWLRETKEAAEQALSEPMPELPFSLFRLFETTGDRSQFEANYFQRRARLNALALRSLIDETDEVLKALEDTVWAICEEYTWSLPAHLPVGLEASLRQRVPPQQVVDLFAAETAHALAETLCLLEARLNPWIKHRITEEVERRIFRPLFYDPAHFRWESADMNWSAVCAGAAGMAALLLVDDKERLAGMMDRVLRAMECFLEGYGEDGGCPEGVSYWVYGFGYYVYFSEMLRVYTDGRLDLLQGDKVRAIAAFPAGVCLSEAGIYVNFSDSDAPYKARYPHTGLLSRLNERLEAPIPPLRRVPGFHSDACYRFAHYTRNFFWTDPGILGREMNEEVRWFPDMQWLAARVRRNGTEIGFAAKGGHNGEPHNHNDVGHFILTIGGEALLCDLGKGEYTRQYFGPQRYENLHTSSRGHSVPQIGGCMQVAGAERAAQIAGWECGASRAMLQLELSGAYGVPELKSFERRLEFEYGEEPRLLLIDQYEHEHEGVAWQERFVSLAEPLVGQGNVRWTGTFGSVVLAYDSSRLEASVEVETADSGAALYCLCLNAIGLKSQDRHELIFTCEIGREQQE